VTVVEITASPSATTAPMDAPATATAPAAAQQTDAPPPVRSLFVRTPAPSTPAPATGPRTFTTLAHGSALPRDEQCARDVGSATWEPRPANRGANQTNAWTQGLRLQGSYLARTAPGYEDA